MTLLSNRSRVYNLRGTNGTGKTTVARALIEESSAKPVLRSAKGKVRAYEGVLYDKPFVVLGSYETVCGGCDTIETVSIAAQLMKEQVARLEGTGGTVFLEGLMISHMLGTVGSAMDEIGKERVLLAYLDTPLETCIQRVVDRRVARGDERPFVPDNVVKDYKAVLMNKARAERMGFKLQSVDHKTAYPSVMADLFWWSEEEL